MRDSVVMIVIVRCVSEPAVEFMTVHVYTCSANCWRQDAAVVEEFAVVEYDRDSLLVDEALKHGRP